MKIHQRGGILDVLAFRRQTVSGSLVGSAILNGGSTGRRVPRRRGGPEQQGSAQQLPGQALAQQQLPGQASATPGTGIRTPCLSFRCPLERIGTSAEDWQARMLSLRGDSLGTTTYLGVVAPNGFFLPTGSRRLSEIIDSPSDTLMVIEVSSVDSVHWMQPVDANELTVLRMNEKSKLPHENGFHAAFVDGSVRFLRGADLSQEDRRAIISVAGQENAFSGSEL